MAGGGKVNAGSTFRADLNSKRENEAKFPLERQALTTKAACAPHRCGNCTGIILACQIMINGDQRKQRGMKCAQRLWRKQEMAVVESSLQTLLPAALGDFEAVLCRLARAAAEYSIM